MQKSFFILCALLSLLALNTAAEAFSVEPARIELSLPAGKQRGRMVTIDNSQSKEPLHLKMYATDVTYLADGTNDFPAAGSTRWSCAHWIKIVPQELDIPAGGVKQVRVSISVPAESKGGYYGMLFFETEPIYQIEGIGMNFRLGILVDIIVKHTEMRKAKLANIALTEAGKIEVDISNEGNVLFRPKGKIKIFKAERKKMIRQLEFNPQGLGILPHSLRKFSVEIEKPLAPDKYIIKAEIDYGTKYLLVGELPINIE